MIQDEQKNMRSAYYGGGFGVLASGTVWLIAGIVATVSGLWTSVITLYVGGIFIHPIGVLIAKAFGRSGKHEKGNRMGALAIESTFAMFVGLFIAFVVAQRIPNWFFSIMLLVIGARYFVFQTIYGDRTYWVFGGVLCLAGAICMILDLHYHFPALLGGVIEIVFAVVILLQEKKKGTQ